MITDPIFNLKWTLHMAGDGLAGAYWGQCGPNCNYTGVTSNIIKRNKNGTDFSKGYNDRVRRAFKKHGVTNFMFISSRLYYYITEGFILEVFEELQLNGDKTIANLKFSFGNGGNTCTDPEARARACVAGGGNKAKPFELRNAITHEPIASFSSTCDESISKLLETLNTREQVTNYLKDALTRHVMLCFWNFGVLCYLCYKNETIEELELRTGRCFESDLATKLRLGIPKKIPFILKVTVTNGTETHHLKGYKTYSEAARMLGLPESQYGNFGKMIQGKGNRRFPSCDGWSVVA